MEINKWRRDIYIKMNNYLFSDNHSPSMTFKENGMKAGLQIWIQSGNKVQEKN